MAASEDPLRRRKAAAAGPEPASPPGRDPMSCPARFRAGTFWLTRVVLLKALAFVYCESAGPARWCPSTRPAPTGRPPAGSPPSPGRAPLPPAGTGGAHADRASVGQRLRSAACSSTVCGACGLPAARQL